MCGIAGEFNFTSAPSQADWDRISLMMARRGPDDAGTWADNPHCTFVFRRLSILDLSANGRQPMLDASGRYVIIFNGEVYNFADLRDALQADGFQFRSHGDTEVVLYALIKWGVDALDKFNGMFALAFYDSLKKHLLLARDHAGIKPLYYTHMHQGVAFASQYDQLLAHPFSRNSKISREALGLYIRLAFIPAPYTILQNTHMLEPGTWVQFSKEGAKEIGRYYDFPAYRKPSLRGDKAVEAVDAAITAAVKRQMVSDVPVGGFLSGGIDSPLVMAKMRSATNGSIHAFTLGTNGDATDESQEAVRYAETIGISQTVENFAPDQALSMLEDVVQACGEPLGDYSIFPTMLISMVASRNFKVMLSGDGGDELFWGYPGRAVNIIHNADAFKMPFAARKLRWGLKKFFNLGHAHHFSRLKTLGHLQRRLHTHLPENWIKRIFPTLPKWPINYDKFDFNGWGANWTAQWHRWNEFVSHLTMVLLKVDRASMYHSLEVRVPLLDREVIAVAGNVDWHTCLDLEQKIGKIPLRRVLARHADYQTKPKRGFAIPMGRWLRTSLRDVFAEKVVQRDNVLGLEVNQKAMRQLFSEHESGKADYGWGLWPLLSLILWSDRNLQNHWRY